MIIKKLRLNDYNSMIALLNKSFSKKYLKEMDFRKEILQMNGANDEFMSKHTGVFEDGKLVASIGLYPLTMQVGETTLKVATVGNVATDENYRGRGYMTALLEEVIKNAVNGNYDLLMLGGRRTRYARFGFEPVGVVYEYQFTAHNRCNFWPEWNENIEFKPIDENDKEILESVKDIYESNDVFFKRKYDITFSDIYDNLFSFGCKGYTAIKNGELLGYVSARKNDVIEEYKIETMGYKKPENLIDILCGFQKLVNENVVFRLQPYDYKEVLIAQKACEHMSQFSGNQYNILNYARVTDAFLKLKSKHQIFSEGEFIIGIEGYGNVKLFNKNGIAGAENTDEVADIKVDRHCAMQIIFGYGGSYYLNKNVKPIAHEFLPLPLGGHQHDCI